ncbi:MAG: hypothetical protein JWQ32_2843 [Marmoricola sp.]|nr:hypothetical protein [Marmoricola sp.]
MRTDAESNPDRGDLNSDDAVAYLRDAGEHPLMYSFPQGALFSFDRDLRYLSAGGLGLADVGLSREMLEGNTIFEVFPEATASIIEPLYRAALAGTPTTWDVPYGGRIYSQRLAPVRNAAGQIVAGLGITHDMTEARDAEHALRESEERNRLTFEHAPIGQAIVELDGTWRQVNAAVTTLTGYTEAELLRMTFQDITHPDDLDLDMGHLNELVAGEISSYQIEKRYLTVSRQIVWVLLSVALVRDDDGTPLYFISQIQDITDRKRQHQALQDLTAILAHDLRTPATVISGFAELLEGPPSADEHVVKTHAARIVAAARSMTELLDNALTATTLDSGQLLATPRAVEVRHSLMAIIENLDLGAVSINIAEVEDLTAWIDPVQFGQVITNLLTNAAKYGGTEVAITATAQHGQVSMSVIDNGPGVDPDFVPYLFDRFARSAAARRGRQRGSGLGLYIVRDLLTANGGSIRYASRPSGGAEFTILLQSAPDLGALARGTARITANQAS